MKAELIDAKWLRSLTDLPVCKNGSGGYSDNEVTLFLNDWESINLKDSERFWVLQFSKGQGRTWSARVSVQENHRHNGTLHMATIKNRSDVLRVLSVLGVDVKESIFHD